MKNINLLLILKILYKKYKNEQKIGDLKRKRYSKKVFAKNIIIFYNLT